MPRFFIGPENAPCGDKITVTGEDARHISLSLRARVGEEYVLCDENGTEYLSKIDKMDSNSVYFTVLEKKQSLSEPSVKVFLYQALVKGDKFDEIVQKAVELGVSGIIPVISSRCVSKPDGKTLEKKVERWRKIAKAAAMQCERAAVPTVENALTYKEALERIKECGCGFVCYETGPRVPLKEIFDAKKGEKTYGFFIGPEGGLSEDEAALARESEIPLASLGSRILRTETAPVCVLSAIMFYSGNME